MRLVTATMMALLVAMPLVAQEPQVQERERQHVVRTGDTLWDLANRYFSNPFQWRLIHEANTRIVADPHWIYPEQVLVIPGLRELVEMTPDATGVYRPVAAPPRTVFYRDPPVRRDGPTVLMDPMAARVPVRAPEFYAAEYLAVPASLPVVGRVIRPVDDVDHGVDLAQSAHPHDELYISYEATAMAPSVGDRLIVAEVGRRVRQAGEETRMIVPRAVIRVLELERGSFRATIEDQFGRVVRDHVAMPLAFYPDFLATAAEPVQGESDLEGRIMVFVDESPLPNRMARAFIDLGAGHGVQVGDIFEAFMPERETRRPGEWIPEETVAELRVVRVTDTTATVTVDEIASPQLAPGIPVRRVRKMP
jgi:hypothetical protein